MFPYLDTLGFRRRSRMASAEIDYVENENPGFTAQAIASRSSYINGRLRKRYGNSPAISRGGDSNPYGLTPVGNSLPLGQQPPLLLSAGTSPPGALLIGRPTLGSLQVALAVTTPGVLGTMVFKYTLDGGVTWVSLVTSAASVVLGASGLTVQFQTTPCTWSADNQYAAATPVPEIVLGWLTVLVTQDMYAKRGVNPADPAMQWLREDVSRAFDEIKEAADSKDGLFDLPVSEDLDSAVTTGGPLGSSDASPYAWQDRQACNGPRQDWPGSILGSGIYGR